MQAKIYLGVDKNGLFFVQVPSGFKLPKNVYSFLVNSQNGCQATYDKSSNSYFGIKYDPVNGLKERLPEGILLVLKDSYKDPKKIQSQDGGQHYSAPAQRAPKNISQERNITFSVETEMLNELQKGTVQAKTQQYLEKAIIVKGTAKGVDKPLIDFLKEKYNALWVANERGDSGVWILANADPKNFVSIYNEIRIKRTELNTTLSSSKNDVVSNQNIYSMYKVGDSVVVSFNDMQKFVEIKDEFEKLGAVFNRGVNGYVLANTTEECVKKALNSLLTSDPTTQFDSVQEELSSEQQILCLLNQVEKQYPETADYAQAIREIVSKSSSDKLMVTS